MYVCVWYINKYVFVCVYICICGKQVNVRSLYQSLSILLLEEGLLTVVV